MLVKDFMTPIIITAEASSSVIDAAKLMAIENIGSLIVTRDDELAGMVTRRDVISAQLLSDDVFHSMTLEDIMESPVVTINPSAELEQAISLMNKTGKHHIPVIEGNEITGVISASDIIRALATLHLIATGADE